LSDADDPRIQFAIDDYLAEVEDDTERWGLRGDADQYEETFLSRLRELVDDSNVLFQSSELDLTYDLIYKTADVVNQKMRGPMPGRQILAMLRGAGVKADELRWTGLDEYLDTDRKITPIALQHYVEEHRVQIDVVKKTQGDVQWDGYVLPNKSGGNYIPANDAYIDYPADGEYIEHIFRLNTPDGGVWFESGHFGENVLAHARTTERFTVPATDSVYMVEEIQSDWHQEGRDKGYSNNKEAARGRIEKKARDQIREEVISNALEEFVYDIKDVIEEAQLDESHRLWEILGKSLAEVEQEAADDDALVQDVITEYVEEGIKDRQFQIIDISKS